MATLSGFFGVLALVGIGLALGIVLTTIASTAAKALLFGLTPSDPLALAAASLTLAA